MKFIPYGKQLIINKDKRIVLKSLSNNLITTGPYVEKFEEELKNYLKCKYAHVCSSGTAAIHLAMLSLNLKKNDVILMPAVNFIASYNAAKIMQLRIYLIDVDKYTGQITPNTVIECIRKNKIVNIKALVTMYNGGYPEYLKEFYDLKKKHNFSIIEDSCHALGASYKYKKKFYKIGCCKHADISTFSMHPLKTITSGEGGIITTNKKKYQKILNYLEIMNSKNKSKHWKYDMLKHGYNYRLSDINCALGFSQLNKINFFLKKRKKIYKKYSVELENYNKNLKVPLYSKIIKPSFHLYVINIEFKKLKKNKDHFIKYLRYNNIIAQQHYIPIYKFSVYNKQRSGFLGSEKYFKNSISIPIFVNLKKKDQDKIIATIKKYFKK